jgi:hypothetical protein
MQERLFANIVRQQGGVGGRTGGLGQIAEEVASPFVW